MTYKLNIHAHTIYSDGSPTVLELATAYKDLGFTCAVISDHYYGREDLVHYSMDRKKFIQACSDAEDAEQKLGYPVIVGMEYGFFGCEEVLCFGRDFLFRLYDGINSTEDFISLRKDYESACVLCHPRLRGGEHGFIAKKGHLCIDGFEHYNSGQNYFKNPKFSGGHTREVPEEFKHLTAFSNSDAHNTRSLPRAVNLIDEPIKSESQLIDYITKKRTVIPMAFGRSAQDLDPNDESILGFCDNAIVTGIF